MGLFGFDPVKEAGGWDAAMTEEEIAEMEKKGYRILQGIGGAVIILCSAVLWVLM